MLSKREITWINSLKNKKYRYIDRAYIAEGPRIVNELLINGQPVLKIFGTQLFVPPADVGDNVFVEVTESELKQVSSRKNPNQVLAVFTMTEEIPVRRHPEGEWGFALEFIQDPGNMGTILRTMDWLGIQHIYCSSDSVDMYNPKVVQASMGAIGHLKISYVDLLPFLSEQEVELYATDMEGEPIVDALLSPGIIVLGNEGRGISQEVKKICSRVIAIPKEGGGESLNVAVTAAILGAWVKLR